MIRGLLLFGVAAVVAALLIKLTRRVFLNSPKANTWATGAILGGACWAASMLSFRTAPSAFDWFGVSSISIAIWLSFVIGALNLAADRKVANEVSIVVFKMSGDEEADVTRSLEIMTDLVTRLRARGLICSDASPHKPLGAGFECGPKESAFYALLEFGPSPGTLSIRCGRHGEAPRKKTEGPPLGERCRILREIIAADDRFVDQRWMSPAERDRLLAENPS